MTSWIVGITPRRVIRLGAVLLIGMLGLLFGILKAHAARASTPSGTVIQTARADVDDGDGLDDVVTIVQRPNHDHLALHVKLADGRELSAPIELGSPGEPPQLVKVGNVNGHPGDELFVAGPGMPARPFEVFTYHHGRLIATGPTLVFGNEDPGVLFSVSCTKQRGRHVIIQHDWLSRPLGSHWTDSGRVYRWHNGTLHTGPKVKRHRVRASATRISLHCGHRPVS